MSNKFKPEGNQIAELRDWAIELFNAKNEEKCNNVFKAFENMKAQKEKYFGYMLDQYKQDKRGGKFNV